MQTQTAITHQDSLRLLLLDHAAACFRRLGYQSATVRDVAHELGMTPGGIIDLPAPLPVSNVMVVCPVCGKPTRVGTIEKTIKDKAVRVRVCKKCGEEIDR